MISSLRLIQTLVFQGRYHPLKMKHIIRVVFQDPTMYAVTSFRGSKTSKMGKSVCFWPWSHILENIFDGGKLRKTCKKCIIRVYFQACILRVCFEIPFKRMMSNLKYKWPHPPSNLFAFLSSCVVVENLNTRIWNSLAENAITQGSIH